jgi:hypothetical protein
MTKKTRKTKARCTAQDRMRAVDVDNIRAFIERSAAGQEPTTITLRRLMVYERGEEPQQLLGAWPLMSLREGEGLRVANTVYGLADNDIYCREATQRKYVVLSYHGSDCTAGPDGRLVFELSLPRIMRASVKYRLKALEAEKAGLLAVLESAH